MTLPTAHAVVSSGAGADDASSGDQRGHSGDGYAAENRVVLTYDARLLRRRRLETEAETAFLVDLPQTVSVAQGDRFSLSDGREVVVIAAAEALLAVTAPPRDMPRIAWHIGNRHAPAMFDLAGAMPRVLIQRDPVLHRMLEGLGAEVTEVTAPFTPEGGAYGHGRTMGHSHGDAGHGHGDNHGHGHDHDQPHSHDHRAGPGQEPSGLDHQCKTHDP